MILITPLPGITTTKPGSATKPFPGIEAGVFDEAGERGRPRRRRLPRAEEAVAGDAARHLRRRRTATWRRTGRSTANVYFAGDGARIDEDGDFWLLGRVDDVMNVSGHRISTIEVETALVDHHEVAEAAVCGAQRRDDRPGDRRLRDAQGRDGGIGREARRSCATTSPRRSARSPSRRTSSSPRSCRRRAAARSCAACCATSPRTAPLGDTTTLADPTVVAEIQSRGAEDEKAQEAES